MITSTDLFDLIRTLSKSEKTYFQKHASVFIREGGNKYVQLFDAIAQQHQYDEKKIIDQFKDEKFTRQFSVAKNYLYNRLLDAMHSYHTSILSEVHGRMDRAEYLFEKGLYKQAGKMLRMAEKMARRHEMHSTLITIHEHQQFNHSIKKREPALAGKNIERSQEEIHLLNNHLEYLKLLAQTQHVYNLYGRTQNKKYLHDFKKIMQNPFLKNESQALTFNGKRRFYDIHAIYNSIIKNNEKAYRFSNKILSLFDEDPEKKKHAAIQYSGYINNTILFCHLLRRYTDIEQHLQQLQEIRPLLKTKYEEARFFEIYTNNLLNLYNTTGRFTQARKLLPGIIEELPGHEKKLADRDKLLLYGNIAYTFFGLGDYKSCLSWINKIRNGLPVNIRPDFESEVQMVNIIVHRELGHTELIPHLVVSFYRLLRKKSLLKKPEKYLLRFLKKLPEADTAPKLIREMAGLRDKIAAYSKAGAEPFFFFDIGSWLESKIQKKEFAAIISERSKKHLK